MKWALYSGLAGLLIAGSVVLATDEDVRFTIGRNWGAYYWPDWELKEVKIWGSYTRENWEEVKEVEDYLRATGYLTGTESAQEKFPSLRLGEERYDRSGQLFCPHTTDEETKNEDPVINPDLRIRLYDRAWNVLSEDFLRDRAPHNTKKKFPTNTEEAAYEWSVVAYVPYHEEGHSLKLVRLEDGKEVLIERLEFQSIQSLKQEIEQGEFYAYILTDDNCFLSPPLV